MGKDKTELMQNEQYRAWLKDVKQKIRQAQLKAAVSVNTVLLQFYWELGAEIVEKQKSAEWGSGFLSQLSKDLMTEFPEMRGFSEANLSYIRRWFLFYNQRLDNFGTGCAEIAKQDIAKLFQIPWGHNRVIISKCQNTKEALFYVQKTLEHNWSRNILTHQMESRLFERKGKTVSNFSKTLPSPQSDLAQQTLKDPYIFDFLALTEDYKERELQKALLDHITKFLLELGAGFAYMGKQVPLQVGQRDFFIDLLFYHTVLHCYVVIELKAGEFEPEHAGKLNFYIKAVDEKFRKKGDEPTIGILLCKSRDKLVAEYALSDIHKPIGVSEYQLTRSLPENLKSSLPSIEEFEAVLSREMGDI